VYQRRGLYAVSDSTVTLKRRLYHVSLSVLPLTIWNGSLKDVRASRLPPPMTSTYLSLICYEKNLTDEVYTLSLIPPLHSNDDCAMFLCMSCLLRARRAGSKMCGSGVYSLDDQLLSVPYLLRKIYQRRAICANSGMIVTFKRRR
jgi:hypothetical protein